MEETRGEAKRNKKKIGKRGKKAGWRENRNKREK